MTWQKYIASKLLRLDSADSRVRVNHRSSRFSQSSGVVRLHRSIPQGIHKCSEPLGGVLQHTFVSRSWARVSWRISACQSPRTEAQLSARVPRCAVSGWDQTIIWPKPRAVWSGGGELGVESTRAAAPGRPQSGRLQPARRGVTRGGPATVTSSAVSMETVHYK